MQGSESVRGTSVGFFRGLIRKPFAMLVAFFGLLFVGLSLLVDLVQIFLIGLFFANPLFVVALIFDLAFFVVAFLALREKPSSFIASAAVSILFVVILAPAIADAITNPTHPAFRFVISGVPALLLVAIFSILSLRHARTGLAQKRYLASPQSTGGLFTLAVIGFVIGSLVIGTISAAIIGRILEGAGSSANIRIVSGAVVGPGGGVPEPFRPWRFAVSLASGGNVTWFNGDTNDHTVTSNGTGPLNSPLLRAGGYWNYTFTQTGTYLYHCTPHATTMWGEVVVIP